MTSRKSPAALLIASLLVIAGPAWAQSAAQEKPTGCAALLEKWRAIAVLPLDNWRMHPASGARGESPELDDSSWETTKRSQSWDAGSYWFRQWVEVPAARSGYDFRGARLEFQARLGSAYKTVYVNGVQRALGEEFEPVVLAENAEPGQKFLIAVKAQVASGRLTFNGGQLELTGVAGRPDVRMTLEECYAAEVLNPTGASGQAERAQTIEAARNVIDWAALDRGDQKRFDASLSEAHTKLLPLHDWLKSYSIHAVGNSHIDMAWLWPWTETVEVVRNTFSSVLKLMQEFPDLKFAHSSVRTYAWIEEKYPALFEEIRLRVKEGRWEIVGGMWVEPDLNMPDGESLVRQLLVGTRYLREKFGVDVKIGWNPDSFGYNWQLPQIYRRSGINYFVTQKMSWNDTTKFPHKLFWWESPDGSRVLAYFPNGYVNQLDPVRLARDTAETARRTGLPDLLHLYGIGDHGGGPTRRMLVSGSRWQLADALFPSLTLTTAGDFFQAIEKNLTSVNLPVWRDELYFEYHRGILTTQAQTKKNNRRNEALLLNTEKFSSIASFLGGPAYPQQDLNDAWRLLLFNQFHDILPGSGIGPVYLDASRDHAVIRQTASDLQRRALAEIAARTDTRGAGVALVVFNPLAWARTDVVEADAPLPGAPEKVEVHGPGGEAAVAEVVSRDAATQRVRVRFIAADVPSLGFKVFHITARAASARAAAPSAGPNLLTASAITLENTFLRLRLEPKSGCITSLFDKRRNREALAPGACGNLLQAFRDKPKDWDAWNIDADFEKERWDLDQAEEVTLAEQGAVRAAIRVVKKFQNSRFSQSIMLYAGLPRVDIRTEADWHEEHILIKAAFPIAAHSNFATFEIPYGSIQRPTTRNSPEEKAKFEVAALRWADLSDAQGGLSLLNDCKYGHDARDNVLRISLLRSPKWPDPNADMGQHEFTYSLYPHGGSWKEADTVRRGYELNVPLLAVVEPPHSGLLPAAHSFVEIAPANVVLTALKKAEDSETWLVRFYEYAGRETPVRIKFRGLVRAWEANLMEKDERPVEVSNGRLVITVKPYEIKTVRVDLRRVAPSGENSTERR